MDTWGLIEHWEKTIKMKKERKGRKEAKKTIKFLPIKVADFICVSFWKGSNMCGNYISKEHCAFKHISIRGVISGNAVCYGLQCLTQ